ncbi:cytochrome ubiquinol oxidase subunit I [Streptomyces sp. NPDC001315]|uniref:cytochrome ubiquinol oxidase subunit I n=1 Tax=Streptomyces sp. NPDC001315 TaxID=3364562 RepID=UPI00369DE2F0
MLLAAYIVAGFVVAGVQAVGMLRGRRDRYHPVGFLTGFVTAAPALPVQIIVGDTVARQLFDDEPAKFAPIALLPGTGSHGPETLGGVPAELLAVVAAAFDRAPVNRAGAETSGRGPACER